VPVPSVVFLGDFSDERIDWGSAACHVEWDVDCVPDLDALGLVSNSREIPAVFVDQATLGISDAMRLRRIRALLPEARLVVCCPIRLISDIDPDEVGAFHALARPLKMEELKAAIGFVWESWSRRKANNAIAGAA
jgi:hypothetical protein